MRQDEYWNRFMESGSVRDYLGFCDMRKRTQATAAGMRDTAKAAAAGGPGKGRPSGGGRRGAEYAGFFDSDRHDIKDDSRGGI